MKKIQIKSFKDAEEAINHLSEKFEKFEGLETKLVNWIGIGER